MIFKHKTIKFVKHKSVRQSVRDKIQTLKNANHVPVTISSLVHVLCNAFPLRSSQHYFHS